MFGARDEIVQEVRSGEIQPSGIGVLDYSPENALESQYSGTAPRRLFPAVAEAAVVRWLTRELSVSEITRHPLNRELDLVMRKSDGNAVGILVKAVRSSYHRSFREALGALERTRITEGLEVYLVLVYPDSKTLEDFMHHTAVTGMNLDHVILGYLDETHDFSLWGGDLSMAWS